MHFDSENLTAPSEYASRNGETISVLQIHHATDKSLSHLRELMSPGGRTVSANGAMGSDGHLMKVVPLDKRAFTSASMFDRRSLTVEVCNTTLADTWGISDACHERLARLAAEMHLELGMPLDRKHIIGHREVPGTYPTACPGPAMDLDRIVRRAREIAGGEDEMRSYMDESDEVKIFIASDGMNKAVIKNINGDIVSAADILNASERKAGAAERAAVDNNAKLDSLTKQVADLTALVKTLANALPQRG